MDHVPRSRPSESTSASVADVRPTLATDDTYTELRRKFIDNGDMSAIGIAQRRDLVRRFEEIDRSVPLVTTPMDGLSEVSHHRQEADRLRSGAVTRAGRNLMPPLSAR